MKLLNNKDIKKVITIFILISLISSIVMVITILIQYKSYKNNIDYRIINIIGNIKESYPELDEENIIKILNEENNYEKGKSLLQSYGIKDDELDVILTNNHKFSFVLNNILILVGTQLLLFAIFIIYLKNRQKRIDELAVYTNKLSNREYDLRVEENSEDELNKLKNELYKITVMLKEDAINSEYQRELLYNSVSDISHQLKTPLTSSLILLDNLSENDDMDEETKKRFILEISNQIEKMNWLVIVMLKLARLDAGVVKFSNCKICVKDLIENVLKNLEILIEINQIEIHIKGEESVDFTGDLKWNEEAILNIVKNAIEHSSMQGKIEISFEENDVYTEIKIKDEGDGMSREDQKHIFERFYKAENSSENSIGIGLALSKTIIEKQNGYIAVESELGKGTTFTIKYMKV